MFPIRTDSPLRTTPWMNWALIAANVIVHMAGPHWMGRASHSLNPRDLSLIDYLAYAFLHGSLGHLLSNMLFLYIFGNNVNDKMGHVGYLAFYLAGGIFAGVGHIVAQMATDPMFPVIGASGAVAAVTGAYLVLFPRSSVTIVYFFIIVGVTDIPSMWFIVFFFLKDVFLNFSGQETGVAHTAHISGTLFGFATSMVLLAMHLLPRDQFDVLALLQRWNKRRHYRNLVREGYNPFMYGGSTPVPPRAEEAPPPDPQTRRILDLRAEIAEAIAHHNLPLAAQRYLDLKEIDSNQVLSRQAQLDVGNQLYSQQLFPQAADAYEQFLAHYPKFEQIEQIELMLGLIYARYLNQYDRAKQYLLRALARLHGEREIAMARNELTRIEPLIANASS